jgi:TrmH family RNA methyltransferase
MMNFGITDLRIVGRDGDWSEETRKRAKNAQEVLDGAKLVDTLETGVSDCSIVIGTSGKREEGEKTSLRHFLLPDELPDRLSDVVGRVAVVFGPEGKGLLNEQLRMCDILVTIPTWEGYPILNLSHAVAIICYSWLINCQTVTPSGAGERLLEPALRERFREESRRLVRSIPTKEHKRKGIEDTLIRVVMRGLPKNDEMHRLIGIISEAADSFEGEGNSV